jgi:hypothetical protein
LGAEHRGVFFSNAMGTESRPAADATRGIVLPQVVSRGPVEVMYYFGAREGDFDAPGVRAPN